MKKYKWLIIIINLIILLVYFNFSIIQKEKILADGKLVLLKLAPVDPRSLMQGDYMRLRYELSIDIEVDKIPARGYCVIKIDTNGVAKKVRLQQEHTPINAGEYLIKYTTGNWDINIGAESYFFEEGQAEKFENAQYGGVRIDNKGNSVLAGLYDEDLNLIE